MDELNTQLRSYYDHIADTQDPVEMADVLSVGEPVRPITRPTTPTNRSWLRIGAVVAGAAAVVFAVALIPIMLRSEAPPLSEDATEPTVTTVVVEETAVQWIETESSQLVLPFAPSVAPQGAQCSAPDETPSRSAGIVEGMWYDDVCYFMNGSEVLFRTTDGVRWEAADTSDRLASISIGPEGFTSIQVVDGTGPLDRTRCSVGEADLAVGQSTDGTRWTITDLPLPRPTDEDGCLEVEWPRFETGPAGMLVTADVFYGNDIGLYLGWWSPDGTRWSIATQEEGSDDNFVWLIGDGTAWYDNSDLAEASESSLPAPVSTTVEFGSLGWTQTDELDMNELAWDNPREWGTLKLQPELIDQLMSEYIPYVDGFNIEGEALFGSISNGSSTVIPVRLHMGFDYTAIGVADFEEDDLVATSQGFEITDSDSVTTRIRIDKQGNTAELINESTGVLVGRIGGSESVPIDLLVEMARGESERGSGLLVSQDGVSWELVFPAWDDDFYFRSGPPITAVPGGSYVVHTATYSELGPPQAILFTSEDGLTWVNRGEPQYLAGVGNYLGAEVFPFADRLQAIVTLRDSDRPGSWESWESEDGITWTPASSDFSRTWMPVRTIPTDFGWIAFAGVEEGTERMGIWVSADSYQWTRLAVPDEYMSVVPGPSYFSYADGEIRLAINDRGDGSSWLSWIGRFEN